MRDQGVNDAEIKLLERERVVTRGTSTSNLLVMIPRGGGEEPPRRGRHKV